MSHNPERQELWRERDRAYRGEVDSITLWLFGGVSQCKGRFTIAGADFRVAVSGPLVSIGLGVLFVLIALAHLPNAVDGAAAWLGYINLILAAFNLFPALPLDGGRVLHAALWRATPSAFEPTPSAQGYSFRKKGLFTV